jgi:membrane protease subunit HflC
MNEIDFKGVFLKYSKSIILPFLIFLVLISQSFFVVNEKQTAIILQFGEVKKVINNAGLSFKTPFIQRVVLFDTRILDFDANTNEVIASDQRRIMVDAFIKYKIIDPVKVYQTSKNETGVEARLDSIIDSTIRQVLGEFKLQDLLTEKRNNIMSKIKELSNNQSQNFGVEIIDVRIKRSDLPKENSQAVYTRMQTERQKEANEYRAEGDGEYAKIIAGADRISDEIIANAKKKAEIIKGEADAKATSIYINSYGKDPEFALFYRTMESYESSIKDKKIMMGFNNEYLKQMDKGR